MNGPQQASYPHRHAHSHSSTCGEFNQQVQRERSLEPILLSCIYGWQTPWVSANGWSKASFCEGHFLSYSA